MKRLELIDLYILEIFKKYASCNAKMTQECLIEKIRDEYSIAVSRRTISGYLSLLREKGYIIGKRGFYAKALFSNQELRLIVDSIIFSKKIPQNEGRAIIDKLKSFSKDYFDKHVNHVHYFEKFNHTDNNTLVNVIDLLDEAIEKCVKVEITHCRYDSYCKLVNISSCVVDPFYIVSSNSYYYLICARENRDSLEHRRLDRISEVKILSAKRRAIFELDKYSQSQFDLNKYMKEHIYMISGDCGQIELKVEKHNISDVVDWFGKDIIIQEIADENKFVLITCNANYGATYYWALQYSGCAEVIKPIDLRNEIAEGLEKACKKYEN